MELVDAGNPVSVAEQVAPPDGQLATQVLSAVDGYGAPVLLACLFVYVVVGAVKHPVHDWLAGRGKSAKVRKSLVNLVNLPAGMLAACFVDFAPIAEAVFRVDLHPVQAIPVGGVLYGAGANLLYRVLRDYDPIEWVMRRFGIAPKRERQADYERRRKATLQTDLTPSTIHDLQAMREERKRRDADGGGDA